MLKGFLKASDDGLPGGRRLFVGASDPPDPKRDYPGYDGPIAELYYDKTWLHIVTDDYEGAAMLNIEALPYLRRALSRIARELRATSEATNPKDTGIIYLTSCSGNAIFGR